MITKEKAVEAFGSQVALARALGITRGAVSQWPAGKPIPEVHALRLKHELRPDIFGPKPEPAGASA